VDNLCGTYRSLVVGIYQRLYDERVHPYFARNRNYCSAGTRYSGAKDHIVDGNRKARQIVDSCSFASLEGNINHAYDVGALIAAAQL
jgi:hypothetical protein